MKIFKINPQTDFNEICEIIRPSDEGRNLMKKKSSINFFLIKDLRSPAANILKQDALSVGAELVTNRDVILGGANSVALLMATDAQVLALAKKEAAQDFGLKNLAKFLKSPFKKPQRAQIMGVVNVNEDSFNAASRVNEKSGIARIEEMIEHGAEYIDVGAVSSRPGSKYVGREIEFARLEKIVAEIYRLMHMQNSPENMQDNPHYEDLLGEIDAFFKAKIAAAQDLGCRDIVLDVGIGFGKTAEQNMILIKNLEHFLRFGLPLLAGASRKSVINFYSPSEIKDRLPGGLYLHLEAFRNGAQIIRTHDVAEHAQMFRLENAMRKLAAW